MTTLEHLREELKQVEKFEEDFPGQNAEHRLQITIEHAIDAARECLDAGDDGSAEEVEYLLSKMALELHALAHSAAQSRLMRRDLDKRAKK